MADSVNLIHVGDQDLIKIAYISALSAQLSKPLHLWPIGKSQKGKSHSLYSTLHVLPKEHYEIFTSASPKSLFYFAKKYGEECFNGKLVFIDEIETSKLTLPMLRSLTSSTDIEPRHLSVYDADLLDLKIKGSRVIWFTSVKAFGADQLRNRFVFVNPDEGATQDNHVFEMQKHHDENAKPNEMQQFQIAQAMTKKVLADTKELKVDIPYIDKISWPYKDRRWLFPTFKSFIECITKIRYKQRQREDTTIISTVEDFETTRKLWANFLKIIVYRVSKTTEELLNTLSKDKYEAKTKAELAEETGYSTQYISKLLDELEEAGLINKQKRQREGPGRLAHEYWKSTLPETKEIRILEFPELVFGLSGK